MEQKLIHQYMYMHTFSEKYGTIEKWNGTILQQTISVVLEVSVIMKQQVLSNLACNICQVI